MFYVQCVCLDLWICSLYSLSVLFVYFIIACGYACVLCFCLLRGRTYAKKLRFLCKKRAGYRKSENAVRLLYAKNSDLTHQNAFSLFVFCTQQRRFVDHLPWV